MELGFVGQFQTQSGRSSYGTPSSIPAVQDEIWSDGWSFVGPSDRPQSVCC